MVCCPVCLPHSHEEPRIKHNFAAAGVQARDARVKDGLHTDRGVVDTSRVWTVIHSGSPSHSAS